MNPDLPCATKLRPALRERVWGRRNLAPWFPDSTTPIGEIWYEADRDLPLLVKLILTSERLSIQVHPDDGEDGERGKTEMWHIVDAQPGATIALGFRAPITRQRLIDAARSGEIEDLVNWMPIEAGETYFTPAHTVHAIGAGIVLFEIQQNSDVTYRLYDYGRPRELHLDAAAPICDLGTHPGPTAGGVVRSKHFVTDVVSLDPGESRPVEERRCHLWICVSGSGEIAGQPYRLGDVWLVEKETVVRACDPTRFLRTYAP